MEALIAVLGLAGVGLVMAGLLSKGKSPETLTVYPTLMDAALGVTRANALRLLGSRLKVDAYWLFLVMAYETGGTFSPSVVNKVSGATGLIQFMPKTARWLGTTVEALGRMTFEGQLIYVELFFKKLGLIGRMTRPVDVYLGIFAAKDVGQPMDHVIYRHPSDNYTQNKGLDRQHKGWINVEDMNSAMVRINEELRRKYHAAA